MGLCLAVSTIRAVSTKHWHETSEPWLNTPHQLLVPSKEERRRRRREEEAHLVAVEEVAGAHEEGPAPVGEAVPVELHLQVQVARRNRRVEGVAPD